jgi:integrase
VTTDAILHTISSLPKHRLKLLSKAVRSELQRRYPDHHKRKYGPTLNRTFTDYEFHRLLQHTKKPKAVLAFKLLRYLGLRIGEVVTIRLQDIDWLNKTIIIHTEKSNTIDTLPLHDHIFYDLREWVNQHHEAILNHDGYILYSENGYWIRSHISKDWLRNYFSACRADAGLNQTYAMTNEPPGRPSRRQYRLTTHSGRRTFATELWHLTRDVKIVQLSLRQTDPKSVDPYIHIGTEEVHEIIRQGFRKTIPQLTHTE